MRNIAKSRIYIVPELSAGNEQWVNRNFGSPDLQKHYDNIKRMVKEKTGRAMQEKERERKGKNGKIIKVAGCSPIREGVMLIRPDTTLADVRELVMSAKDAGVSHRSRFICTRTRDIGCPDNHRRRTGRVSRWVTDGSSRITMRTLYSTG